VKLREVIAEIRCVLIPEKGVPVEKTVANEAIGHLSAGAKIRRGNYPQAGLGPKSFFVSVAGSTWKARLVRDGVPIPKDKEWVYVHVDRRGSVLLLAARPCFLYAGFRYLVENFLDEDAFRLQNRLWPVSFAIEKSTFDLFLTQYGRIIRRFDRERYIREYARLGFTHIEVNALAGPFPHEQGVPLEFYRDFYTYCPALDQFVESRLSEGLYPREYLEANLNRLKKNARLALHYGLAPGLLCFEPRSVPEAFFERYPTLRGARVDHPFRSFKPRYSLTLVHPVVKKHYDELISKLMKEVPELEFMTVWSNDSGSGFEHTKSLYVGRNGGAYMIREWRDDEEIAEAAATNIAGFFRLLRDAASRVNPRFRVITRLESFYGERRHLWPKLGRRIDVEANSLLAPGWENNYTHPVYRDIRVLGSGLHNTLWRKECGPAAELENRGSRAYFYHFFNSHGNHEPLLGIPFPWLTYEKLRASARLKVAGMAHVGGLQPPDKVPYAVNQEVFRRFQFDPFLDINRTVLRIAESYAGPFFAPLLVRGWRLIDRAVRNFVPLPLYSGYGTVWNRLLVRPLVPDIGKIPEAERAYYETIMVSPVHNPNKVDLARDVLFELIPKSYARKAFSRIDHRVWRSLLGAMALFRDAGERSRRSGDDRAQRVFEDQFFRTRALRCLFETLRNAAVWIYAVHEWVETGDRKKKARCRKLLAEMIAREIDNAADLLEIWERAPVEWMAVSEFGETPFMYGENFGDLLKKKIALMRRHGRDNPGIDPDFMFRVRGDPYAPPRSQSA
jgi:hypothetical protein